MDEDASIAMDLVSSSYPTRCALPPIDGASDGMLNFFPNRTFNYIPRPVRRNDSFAYTVSDGPLQSNIATVTIIVTAESTPDGDPMTPPGRRGHPVTISVLSNDSDPDGDC